VSVWVSPFDHVANTVNVFPENETVVDPPPGMVPLEGVAPGALNVSVSIWALTIVHDPGDEQNTSLCQAEATPAVARLIAVATARAAMGRRRFTPAPRRRNGRRRSTRPWYG